jgi:hypothetical protein
LRKWSVGRNTQNWDLKVGGAQLEHSFCDDGELEAGVGISEDDPAEIHCDEVDPDLLSQGDPRILRDNGLTNDAAVFLKAKGYFLTRVTSEIAGRVSVSRICMAAEGQTGVQVSTSSNTCEYYDSV